MKRKMNTKANTVLRFLLGMVLYFLFFMLAVFLYAEWITKNETAESFDLIFLCGSVFIGCLLSCIVIHKSSKYQKTISCLVQSVVNTGIVTVILLILNRFSVSPLVLLIPAIGILGGFCAGVLLQIVFVKS